jgi:hypothetical protein
MGSCQASGQRLLDQQACCDFIAWPLLSLQGPLGEEEQERLLREFERLQWSNTRQWRVGQQPSGDWRCNVKLAKSSNNVLCYVCCADGLWCTRSSTSMLLGLGSMGAAHASIWAGALVTFARSGVLDIREGVHLRGNAAHMPMPNLERVSMLWQIPRCSGRTARIPVNDQAGLPC